MIKFLLKAELPLLVASGIAGQKLAAKLWAAALGSPVPDTAQEHVRPAQLIPAAILEGLENTGGGELAVKGRDGAVRQQDTIPPGKPDFFSISRLVSGRARRSPRTAGLYARGQALECSRRSLSGLARNFVHVSGGRHARSSAKRDEQGRGPAQEHLRRRSRRRDARGRPRRRCS